jgi:hypothetical protein
VRTALEFLESLDAGHGTYNFNEILKMHTKFPNVFFPLFRLQMQIIQYVLGESFWEPHKVLLQEYKADRENREMQALKKRQKDAADQQKDAVSDEAVRARMGYVKFYLMPWARDGERKKIVKIAAIEAELERVLVNTKKGEDEDDD